MDEAWEQGLAKITQFVGNHPEISINCNSISIPETVRPEFYRLFKQVSEQMLNSEYPLLLEESILLSQKYVEIERKISRTRCNPNDRKRSSQQETLTRKNTLWYKLFHWRQLSKFKLHCITVDSHLDAFLHEPLTAMTRLLFDPIFAFLQSNGDPHKFKDTVDGKIKGEFCSLYQRGYRRWVILHLIRLMQPDALYKVMTPETSAKVFAKLEACNEEIKVNVPSPRRTDILDFRYARKMHALSNVDMLIHSKSMRKYAGIKTMFEAAAHTAVITRQKRPYLPFEQVNTALKNEPILIYLDDDAVPASLVADKKRFWRPDIVIDIKGTATDGMPDTAAHEVIQPIIGTIVVPLPNSAVKPPDNIEPNISVLNVGFEASKLMHILNKMA